MAAPAIFFGLATASFTCSHAVAPPVAGALAIAMAIYADPTLQLAGLVTSFLHRSLLVSW